MLVVHVQDIPNYTISSSFIFKYFINIQKTYVFFKQMNIKKKNNKLDCEHI